MGASRQDDIGKSRVAFLPDRLVDDEFEIGRAVHLDIAVGVAERAEDGVAVAVEHMHRRMPGGGIDRPGELAFDGACVPNFAFRMAVDDGVGQLEARNDLGRRVDRRQLRHALVQADRQRGMGEIAGDTAIGVTGEIEAEVMRHAELQVADIDTWLAQTLHGDQADHHARPLIAGGIAGRAAEGITHAADRQIGAFRPPSTGQRAHVFGRYAGLRLLPFRCLRRAVLGAQHIVAPDIEAFGAGLHIFLVIKIFGDPHIGDGQRQRRRGARPRGDPLAAEKLCGVVEMRVDMNKVDIELFQPLAAHRAFEAGIDAISGLRIARPEDHHFGVFQTVLDGAERFAAADP